MSLNSTERSLLADVLEFYRASKAFPEVRTFRLQHEAHRSLIDDLTRRGYLRTEGAWKSNKQVYRPTLMALLEAGSPFAREIIGICDVLLLFLKDAYRADPSRSLISAEVSSAIRQPLEGVLMAFTFLQELPIWSSLQQDQHTGQVAALQLNEAVLDAEPFGVTVDDEPAMRASDLPAIKQVEISGYRPFDRLTVTPGALTVVIGANASGKSSLFDFFRFLAFAAANPLPPEIDPNSVGKSLFRVGGPERISFSLTVDLRQRLPLRYEAEIQGPIGRPVVSRERLATTEPLAQGESQPFVFMDFIGGKGVVRDQVERRLKRPAWTVEPNELALRRALDPTLITLSRFQNFLMSWRFYSGFDVSASAAIRRPVPTEPTPTLAHDGANLSAVLFWLMTEHPEKWRELETHLRSAIPGFQSLNVRAQGGPGTVIGVWKEAGVRGELALADLSDGTLRLVCWLTLCLSPTLPLFVCIDEPELGLHPRVLPVVAGLLRLASSRSQLIVATHSPYLVAQFSLEEIAVMRKENGQPAFVRPSSNAALRREIEEIGGEALARMHISDELETRA